MEDLCTSNLIKFKYLPDVEYTNVDRRRECHKNHSANRNRDSKTRPRKDDLLMPKTTKLNISTLQENWRLTTLSEEEQVATPNEHDTDARSPCRDAEYTC